MRLAGGAFAGAVGAGAGLGAATVVPPALGVVAGAFVALAVLQLPGGLQRYGVAGTVYLLAFALGIVVLDPGGGYDQTTLVALAVFGVLSALKAGLDLAIDRGIETVLHRAEDSIGSGESDASEIETALSAGAGLVEIGLTVVGLSAGVLWYVLFAAAAAVGVVLNALGIEVLVPLVVVDHSLDLVMVAVVGAVTVGFFVCGFVADLYHTLKTSVGEGKELRDRLGKQ